MLMQKHSPNNKSVENDDIVVNSVDSLHSNGHFFSGRNTSLAGSECNDDKSNDACSSDDESHEHDNMEQENQTNFIDSSNRVHFKSSGKKSKKKTVKVKFAGSQDDKTGIKLKIRRTNNLNQDENHVIVDSVEQQGKRHLKNKRCKSLSQDSSGKIKLEDSLNNGGSDDNLSIKRSKTESEDESRISVGVNTMSKGTEVDDSCLGPCQAGTKLSLESVVLMETKSGILIVRVEWRGKTLMGALMESDRFQIGSIEKDSIYRREKLMGMNRRNTRRKSKNLYGKKKRKLTTPPDSGEHGGTENEAGNSDVDNPYCCDKESCLMRFADFQTLRIHIYQKHRFKGEFPRNECVKGNGASECLMRGDSMLRSSLLSHLQSSKQPSLPDLVRPDHTNEERNTFSPAYSDISDANEAPVLENEAELKPPLPPASSVGLVAQPAINLSTCHTAALLTVPNRRLFSPTAPALQPEVTICSSQPPHIRLPPNHDSKAAHNITNYRLPYVADSSGGSLINGFIQNLPSTNHKSLNGTLSNIPLSESLTANSIQDLSINTSLNVHKLSQKPSDPNSNHNNHHTNHKTAPNLLNCNSNSKHHHQQQQPISNRHNQLSHIHSHHHMHSSNTSLTNGLINNPNSKHYLSSENAIHNNQPPLNGVPLSHLSFSPSISNQNNKLSYPINHMYQPQKF